MATSAEPPRAVLGHTAGRVWGEKKLKSWGTCRSSPRAFRGVCGAMRENQQSRRCPRHSSEALGSPLRALSLQLGHFPASCPSGRSRAEAAGTRHLCHPAGTTLPSQPRSWLPWELRPWAGRCPPRGPRLSSALVWKGQTASGHLTGPTGWSHKGLPVVTWLSRGRFAVAQGGGKAESKCHVF